MSEVDTNNYAAHGEGSGEVRQRGARRQKIYGYLKAANDIRHSYQFQLTQPDGSDDNEMHGSFSDVEIVGNGDEELVLFPSYAKRHVKKRHSVARDKPGSHEGIGNIQDKGDADYWKKQWELYEDDNAVVDVDVRGWVFSPHRHPLNRKNRLLVAVARKLSGIAALPANSPVHSRASSQHSIHPEKYEDRTSRQEDEAATKVAQSLVDRGEGEAEAAWRGSFSFDPTQPSPFSSRSTSPARPEQISERSSRTLEDFTMRPSDEDPGKRALAMRRSWNQPAHMSREELAQANEHLMNRLKSFMTIPLAAAPITLFFYNDETSQSKVVQTNDSGQFNVRASLNFVPTHVRALASEKLAATDPVQISEMKGISLISDIDDTIKHSAISSGAKEIFKNTFIRELGDLTIPGVKEWYNKVANIGVQFHYVSNSPWQLFPVLKMYFHLAGLPQGSIHLKAYTGMLQGIFEPAAERKRGSLERIMSDFPERRFILVGDSGEADLEVYIDVVQANPGRVLGVFIRDVTTAETKQFFDSNHKPESRSSINGSGYDSDRESRPSLPERRNALSQSAEGGNGKEENLINFDEPEEIDAIAHSYTIDLAELDQPHNAEKSALPTRPSKPVILHSLPTDHQHQPTNHERLGEKASAKLLAPKPPPQKPRRPSTSVKLSPHLPPRPAAERAPLSSTAENQHKYPTLPARPKSPEHMSSPTDIHTSSNRPHLGERSHTLSLTRTQSHTKPGEEEQGYSAIARRQLASAYNALPSIRSSSPPHHSVSPEPRRASGPESTAVHHKPPPPVPLRRGLTSYPVAAARWATGISPGDYATAATVPGMTPISKKEEMWKRRWARAEDIMHRENVVLKTWRVGGDVMDECVTLVEGGQRDLMLEEGGKGARRRRAGGMEHQLSSSGVKYK